MKAVQQMALTERILAFDRALDASEVAHLLNIAEKTVYKNARARIMPSFRIGTSVRFDPKQLADWLSRQ